MSDAMSAFKAALLKIQQAADEHGTELRLSNEVLRPLDRLPPEIGSLTNLRVLDLSNTNIVDLEPITGLTNLQTLSLTATTVRDLTPVATLTKLRSLEFMFTEVADVEPLKGLFELQRLLLADP